MLPLEKFPEVPEGLEKEIYRLYESTVSKQSGFSYSNYFGANAETFALDEGQARGLDRLVDCIYGTCESIKIISSDGRYKPKEDIIVEGSNVFQVAAAGGYNETGLVYSDFDNGELSDYKVLVIIGKKIADSVIPFISAFFSRDTFELILPERQADVFKSLKKDALAALEQKLRFEAAIYEGMKAHYGISVKINSNIFEGHEVGSSN